MANIDTPIWLLDVDGVLNVDRPPWHEPPHQGYAYYNGKEYKIRWSPSLAQRVRTIIAAKTATVMWSTTWCIAAEQIERLLHFPQLHRVFGTVKVTNEDKLWIADTLAKSGCRVIWTDDTAIPDAGDAYDRLSSNNRVLMIRPDDRRGLTPDDMDRIEAFIGAGDGS